MNRYKIVSWDYAKYVTCIISFDLHKTQKVLIIIIFPVKADLKIK